MNRSEAPYSSGGQHDPEEARAPARRGVVRRPAGWALGLPALALLCVVAALRVSPAIEINIRREAVRLAKQDSDTPLSRLGARVSVEGRDVRIVTDAELPEDLRGATETRTRAIPAVRLVRTEATGYVTLSPYPFAIRKGDGGIVLEGAVPDAALRNALVDQASRFVPADQVEDRLRLAAGAPQGFADAARMLIDILAPQPAAEGSLRDRMVVASASPADAAAYNSVMVALARLPSGFTGGEHEIVPPRIQPFVWTARRDGGGVALGGLVPSEPVRRQVVALAGSMLPGLPVRDSMQTARGLDRSVDFIATARAAFQALALLNGGEAQLAQRRFSLTGETVVKDGARAIERRVRESLPAVLGAPFLTVAVVPASPYVFQAKRAGGRVELTGFLPDERDRSALLALVAARFPGEPAIDRLIEADGAPPGFSGVARSAVETLSDFAEGEASIQDRDLRLSGRVLYAQLAARIRRSVPRAVPEGWRGQVQLDPVQPAGALDAYLCGDLLNDAARRNPVRFPPGAATPTPASAPALEAVADIVRRCGRVGIRIVHHLSAAGEPQAARDLAADRAHALVTALSERGALARFSVEGAVATAPPASQAAPPERNEFLVTPL